MRHLVVFLLCVALATACGNDGSKSNSDSSGGGGCSDDSSKSDFANFFTGKYCYRFAISV